MANDSRKQIIQDARRWIEQEKAWGNGLYATPKGGAPKTAANPERPREEVLLKNTTHRSTGFAANLVTRSSDSVKKAAALQSLYDKYNSCTRCPLGSSRLKFVFGIGNPDARVMFIGEGPGYEEDHRGEPFIGRAGQLLDKMLEAIGLSRKDVYIANVVKCHAMINPQTPHEHGNDRPPTPEEVATCSPILQQQIAVIQPKIIVTLGSPSTKAILATQEGISKIRGKLVPMPMGYFKSQRAEAGLFEDEKPKDDYRGLTSEQLEPLNQIQVLPMYHPAALLRNPNLKKDAWEDMKLLRDTLKSPA